MKISELINNLENIQKEHGDIEVELQENPSPEFSLGIQNTPNFFIIPEEYTKEDGGWIVNIRSWPY